jgi:protein-S-isoprenylcysteine O-methyltransferase Ste14
VKPKDSSAVFGCALGAAVQVGDRLLIARTMRLWPREDDTVDRREVTSVTSPLYLLPAAGSVVAFAANRLRADRRQRWAVRVTATGLVLAGFVLRTWTLRVLGAFYSPIVEVRSDHRVVTRGPYRYVRHPGYLAGLMQSIGVGVAFSNLIGGACVAASWLGFFIPRIRDEEETLTAALGDDYREFCATRARLLPGIW